MRPYSIPLCMLLLASGLSATTLCSSLTTLQDLIDAGNPNGPGATGGTGSCTAGGATISVDAATALQYLYGPLDGSNNPLVTPGSIDVTVTAEGGSVALAFSTGGFALGPSDFAQGNTGLAYILQYMVSAPALSFTGATSQLTSYSTSNGGTVQAGNYVYSDPATTDLISNLLLDQNTTSLSAGFTDLYSGLPVEPESLTVQDVIALDISSNPSAGASVSGLQDSYAMTAASPEGDESIPEPATAPLLAGCLAGIGLWRRRTRSAS